MKTLYEQIIDEAAKRLFKTARTYTGFIAELRADTDCSEDEARMAYEYLTKL